jgi:hypothetical protein
MVLHTETDSTLSKPDGGYCSIPLLTLGLLWWAYTNGLLTLRAVRVGLALGELRIRRAAYIWTEKRRGQKVPDFIPRYSIKELGDYCGLPEKRAKAALAELQGLGLLSEFSEARIAFAPSLQSPALTPEQRAEFQAWLAALTRRKRVPIPRRILALACESSAPALIAVVLGVCLRCAWLRPGEGCSFTGRIACPWLARRFGISLRAVQRAKEHLVALGWIERTGQINRFGETLAINPAWHRLGALPEIRGVPEKHERAGEDPPTDITPPADADAPSAPLPERGQTGTNSAGVQAPAGTNPAGVSLTRESLPAEEPKDQRESQAAGRRPETPGLGISIPQKGEQEKSTNTHPTTLPPPRLSAIRPEDFQDIGRALELFRQAVRCGLAPNDSEHARLLWMAAVERARTVGAENPAGLFLFLVKHRRWDFLSAGHIESANARLKAYLYGGRRREVAPQGPARPAPPRPVLSRDAQLVQAVKNELSQRGLRCELFSVLRRQAGWDRARFEVALAELEGTARESAVGCGLGLG